VSGIVVWFTGLPQSGKSTLAARVRERLAASRRSCVLLDGDELRVVLGADSYEAADRDERYRRLAALAALLARQGHVVLVAATAPRRDHRSIARTGAPHYVEVWVRTALADCEARDQKGLYARARAGGAPTLPGVGAPYEPPLAPDVTADGGHDDDAVATIERLVACHALVAAEAEHRPAT
jgi:adenylylsulfate kinase